MGGEGIDDEFAWIFEEVVNTGNGGVVVVAGVVWVFLFEVAESEALIEFVEELFVGEGFAGAATDGGGWSGGIEGGGETGAIKADAVVVVGGIVGD